jgi:hypothetical protein
MIETLDTNPFQEIWDASFKFREEVLYNTDTPATIRRPEISKDNLNEWNSYFVEVYNFARVVSHIKDKKALIKKLSHENGELGGFRFFQESIPEGSNLSTDYIYFYPQGSFKLSGIHSEYPCVEIATIPTEWLLKPFIVVPIHAIIDSEVSE